MIPQPFKQNEYEEEETPENIETLTALLQSSVIGPDFSDLVQQGILFLNGIITDQSVQNHIKALWSFHLNKSFNNEIQLIINSPGGNGFGGWGLIDTIESIRLPVRTTALGMVGSMAVMVFIAGDTRIMSPNSFGMIHHFSATSQGSYKELVADRKFEDHLCDKSVQHFLRHSKYKTKNQVLKYILKDQNNWLSPQEMKHHGLCDAISGRKQNVKQRT